MEDRGLPVDDITVHLGLKRNHAAVRLAAPVPSQDSGGRQPRAPVCTPDVECTSDTTSRYQEV